MSYDFPIEYGKVREFARATRNRNRVFDAKDAPIPPTFLTTARLVWEPRDQNPLAEVELNMQRILHGEEEYVFHGPPPRAGQTLRVDTRLADQWVKEGKRGGTMRFALVVNEFRDEAGTLVAEQRTTLVETGKPPKEG